MSSIYNFIIEDGVLKYYTGNDSIVQIPEGVRIISSHTFSNCSFICEILIPEGVTTIGEAAFSSCTSLSKINIPDSVSSIGKYAFRECESIEEIALPKNIKKINDYTFSGCVSLEEIIIPENVTSIGAYAFSECKNLKQIDIGANIKSIGAGAFSECSSLTELILPDNITSIAENTFLACSALRKINLPENIDSIGEKAFYDCSKLERITIPDSVKSIGNEAFSRDYYILLIIKRDSIDERLEEDLTPCGRYLEGFPSVGICGSILKFLESERMSLYIPILMPNIRLSEIKNSILKAPMCLGYIKNEAYKIEDMSEEIKEEYDRYIKTHDDIRKYLLDKSVSSEEIMLYLTKNHVIAFEETDHLLERVIEQNNPSITTLLMEYKNEFAKTENEFDLGTL